jgi:Flp pilus assembly pilin Flp
MQLFHNLTSDLVRSLVMRARYEQGQTMAEYAILIAVIALVVIAGAVLLGGSISALFNNAAHKV